MNSSNLVPQDMSSKKSEDAVIGGKRPLNRTGKNGEILSEKKLRRLEKNRLSARECRRRKREATENLERQINMLEGENLRLRLQLQVRFFKKKTITLSATAATNADIPLYRSEKRQKRAIRRNNKS